MIELQLIGMGTGSLKHLTLEAVETLKAADLVLLPRKGAEKSDLIEVRRTICMQILPRGARVVEFDMPVRDRARDDYIGGVEDWHEAIAETWSTLIRTHLPHPPEPHEGASSQGIDPPVRTVALLVWGDPSLYDSSLRIAARLQKAHCVARTRVIPGITSLQLLTAAHTIPLNTVGGAVHVTTGRRLRAEGWPQRRETGSEIDTVVVFLDGDCAFQTLTPENITIYWGAYLGLPQEHIMAGALTEVGPDIQTRRAELQAQQGWIMDVYLLRRQDRQQHANHIARGH